jgi:hypothetical protein
MKKIENYLSKANFFDRNFGNPMSYLLSGKAHLDHEASRRFALLPVSLVQRGQDAVYSVH